MVIVSAVKEAVVPVIPFDEQSLAFSEQFYVLESVVGSIHRYGEAAAGFYVDFELVAGVDFGEACYAEGLLYGAAFIFNGVCLRPRSPIFVNAGAVKRRADEFAQ